MSHRSAVTFDTVCLILFVSCVLSFRLSLRLCFPCFLFLISTSHHNTTNFLSHAAAAAAAIHTYPRAAAAAATTTPTIALKFHPKHEKRKQKR